ncbi:MAG: radical SAM protein [Chitinispirillaceae bacterium]|nr:radical SAM protein [Chitinispirillaceae bacterium]
MTQQKFKQLRDRGFPANAAIELTRRCNLRCDYCFVTPCPSELSTAQVFDALDRLADAGIISLILTGGEPFLRGDIIAILDYIVKKRFFDTAILSNGTVLTRDHIDFLRDYADFFGFLRFTFFSHHASLHDAFTGVQGSFDRTLAAADALQTAGVRTMVIINLTEANIDTIDETKAFFYDRGFTVHIGSTKINATEHIRTAYAPTTTKRFYKKYLSLTVGDGVEIMRKRFEENLGDDPFEDLLCEKLFGMVTILANGDIVPCPSFRNHTISNIIIDNRSIDEIIHTSDLYRELRALKRSHLEQCRECRFKRFCILCPGMMYSENGSWKKPMQQTCNYAHAYYETLYEQR